MPRSAVVAGSASSTFTIDRTDGFDVATGVTCGDVVESVERIHAELGYDVLVDSERFGDGHVVPEERRATIRVETRVAVVIQSWVAEDAIPQ